MALEAVRTRGEHELALDLGAHQATARSTQWRAKALGLRALTAP
jgi:hypothetical protein